MEEELKKDPLKEDKPKRRNLSIETHSGYLTTWAKLGYWKNFFKEEPKVEHNEKEPDISYVQYWKP